MAEHREEIFFHWSSSLQKYDQFIAGLLGAWVAYLIQGMHPVRVSFWPPNAEGMEVGGVCALVVALVAAVLRIGRLIDNLRLSHDIIPYTKSKHDIDSALPNTPLYETLSGDPLTPKQREKKIDIITSSIDRVKKGQNDNARFAYACYHIRNTFGLVGILLILASRIWSAY